MDIKRYYVPDYVIKFKCSSCARCCKTWNISIDKETMGLYRQLAQKDDRFAAEMESNIRVKQDQTGKVIFTAGDGKCPFLTEDNLCSIQLRYGIEALPDVAKKYPRVITLTERGYEIALDYSCPTAARLLKEKGPARLYQNPESFEFVNLRGRCNVIGDAEARKECGKESYFQFEKLLIDIIQSRELGIDERLILAGIVIERICRDYTSGINTCMDGINHEFADRMRTINPSTDNMIILISKVIEMRENLLPFGKESWNAAYDMIAQDFKDMVLEEKSSSFMNAYSKLYEPLKRDIEHIFENYFVNFIFSKRFYAYAYMDAFFLMVLLYVITRAFAVCRCIREGEKVNQNMVVETIYNLERALGHLNGYYEMLIRKAGEENMIRTAYMFSVISLKPYNSSISTSNIKLFLTHLNPK